MQVAISNNIKIKNPSTEEKTYVVYRHIFPNGKSYIGITCSTPYHRRWTSGARYRNQPKMNNAIEKYGWDNVQHEILFENLSRDDANKIEQEMIAKYNSIVNGYNVSAGGGGNYGFKFSEESKLKMSLAKRGKCSPWAARNLREYVKKHGAWNRGKHLSEAHHQALIQVSKKRAKPITAYDPITGEVVSHFDSCEAAARLLGITPQSIRPCLKGRTKTSAGYIWRYDNESV